VATAADSRKYAMGAGKVDGIDDVGDSSTLNDQCRVFVDERVVVPSGRIVVWITRTQYPATQTTFKFLDNPCGKPLKTVSTQPIVLRTRALETPAAWSATARRIPLCRRGYGPDRADRRWGASRSLSPGAGVATTLPHHTALYGEREPLSEGVVALLDGWRTVLMSRRV
jgi:hypothetical protein